ncbi:MAG: dockerin type I domain-containing protein [Patescibacteria group bacterium]
MGNSKSQTYLIAFILFVLFASIVAYFLFTNRSPLSIIPSQESNSKKEKMLKGDINHDGAVDTFDADLIQNSTPCNHVDPCWNKVVGKTRDGDNPIYTSDLDLNHDDNVNELDVSAMSSE